MGVGGGGREDSAHSDFSEGLPSDSQEDSVPQSPVPPDPRRLRSGCSALVSNDRSAVYVGKKKDAEDLGIPSRVVLVSLIPFFHAV